MGDAGCFSCKRAIEHAGNHINGITDINVDIAAHMIRVSYGPNREKALEELKKLVGKIGYDIARIE